MEIPEKLTPDLEYLVKNLQGYRNRMTDSPTSSDWLHRTNLEVALTNIHALKHFQESVIAANDSQDKLTKMGNFLAISNFVIAAVAAIIAILN